MDTDALEELERLKGRAAPEFPDNRVLIRIPVQCEQGCSENILSKIEEVMKAVVTQVATGTWPEPEEWRTILPDWFVRACADERSTEENERWLAWWRSLPRDEQAPAAANAPWTLLNWLHWFAPGADQRQWSWWKGIVDSDSNLSVVLAAEAWPSAHGALNWIVRAAGATPLAEESVRARA